MVAREANLRGGEMYQVWVGHVFIFALIWRHRKAMHGTLDGSWKKTELLEL